MFSRLLWFAPTFVICSNYVVCSRLLWFAPIFVAYHVVREYAIAVATTVLTPCCEIWASLHVRTRTRHQNVSFLHCTPHVSGISCPQVDLSGGNRYPREAWVPRNHICVLVVLIVGRYFETRKVFWSVGGGPLKLGMFFETVWPQAGLGDYIACAAMVQQWWAELIVHYCYSVS